MTGYTDQSLAQRFTADSSAPKTYAFPSFSDPTGTIRLVEVLTGPQTGDYLSPDDRGVDYQPGR